MLGEILSLIAMRVIIYEDFEAKSLSKVTVLSLAECNRRRLSAASLVSEHDSMMCFLSLADNCPTTQFAICPNYVDLVVSAESVQCALQRAMTVKCCVRLSTLKLVDDVRICTFIRLIDGSHMGSRN